MFNRQKFWSICIENNIEPIYAPANNHRAIGLSENLIQTIKPQLSCMKEHLKKFSLEHAIHAKIQKLRITKQKQQISRHLKNI